MRRLFSLSVIALAASACGQDPVSSSTVDAGVDGSPIDNDAGHADWIVSLDGTTSPRKLSPGLLGHYDLSGGLFRYDLVTPALGTTLAPAGFRDWRIGLGRWESGTQLLPKLTDGTPCVFSGFPPQAMAANGATDLDLIKSRDWFIDDGKPVTANAVADDARYQLAPVRRAIDVAKALGATPMVNIDLMPRAFAANKTPSRTVAAWPDACQLTWTNAVSNVAPEDAYVTPPLFAQAVAGVVRRVIEGNGSEPPREAPYWEFWNEPELAYAWNPAFDNGAYEKFYTVAVQTLALLDAYRKQATTPAAKNLHFGFAAFARAATAVGVIGALDTASAAVPIDFFSFHAYSNDPIAIVADVASVIDARAKSTRFTNTELLLDEWGPNLDASLPASTMDQPLLVATVLARAATLGLDRAYHSLFYDYFDIIPWGIVDHGGKTTPLFHAFALLSALIGNGSDRLIVQTAKNGAFGGDEGAVLASRDAGGKVRILVVNRASSARTVRVEVGGEVKTPTRVRAFDAPASGPVDAPTGAVVRVPARAIALLEL